VGPARLTREEEGPSSWALPIALFVVLPIIVLLLVGLVLVIRGWFFGAKKTGEDIEEHAESDDKPQRGFFG
jgi:hypothetical protein